MSVDHTPPFPESVLSVLDTLKQDILECKASYDVLYHENTRLKLENARMKENEIDMLKASTVVTALNETHKLREEVRLLKGSLRKALSENRSQTVYAAQSVDTSSLNEEPPADETDEAFNTMETMVFKKITYYIDEAGSMYTINADSSVGNMVGTARIVNDKYKVKFNK